MTDNIVIRSRPGFVVYAATGHAVRVLSPRNAPSASASPPFAAPITNFYDTMAIPAESFAPTVFARIQSDDVNINEIVFYPTRQEL